MSVVESDQSIMQPDPTLSACKSSKSDVEHLVSGAVHADDDALRVVARSEVPEGAVGGPPCEHAPGPTGVCHEAGFRAGTGLCMATGVCSMRMLPSWMLSHTSVSFILHELPDSLLHGILVI